MGRPADKMNRSGANAGIIRREEGDPEGLDHYGRGMKKGIYLVFKCAARKLARLLAGVKREWMHLLVLLLG